MPGMTGQPTTTYDAKFDLLFTQGRDAVLAGTHHRDGPLVEGGRWGLSVVLRPDPATAARLAAVAAGAHALAGPQHWRTGSEATSHVTVLPLEPYRHDVPAGDPHVARYTSGLKAAAAASRPVRLRFDGLTLTRHSVMACAYPVDDTAETLAANLKDAIGRNQWSERDIWYANLVHFAAAIYRPQELVDWVAARRRLDLGFARIDDVRLVGWRSDGSLPEPVPLGVAPLRAGA
jgi:hypothetical protein